MTDRACILCPTYRPDGNPRLPDRPPICEGDRRRLGNDLHDIRHMHHRLLNPDPVEVDQRRYRFEYDIKNGDGNPAHVVEMRRADPLSALPPGGAIPGRSSKPSVSGSRERSIPIHVDSVDLGAPNRPGSIGVRMRYDVRSATNWAAAGGDPDQVGVLSVATELDFWVRDWRDALWPDHHLPPATVTEMVEWLGNRLDKACTEHPAIEEFAAKVSDLRHRLRAALGETTPRPEVFDGVACRRCDLRAMVRNPGDSYHAECGGCGLLYTEEEFRAWTRLLAASVDSMSAV